MESAARDCHRSGTSCATQDCQNSRRHLTRAEHIVQHNISGNLITVLTLVELITTDLLHKHHTTPELNLKTNQGVRDYAAGLALHLNDGRRTDDAGTKCGVCMRKCLSTRGFFTGRKEVGEQKKKDINSTHGLFLIWQRHHCLKVIGNLGCVHLIWRDPSRDMCLSQWVCCCPFQIGMDATVLNTNLVPWFTGGTVCGSVTKSGALSLYGVLMSPVQIKQQR